MALWTTNFWSTLYDVWLLMLLFKSVAHLKLPIHKLFIFFVTLEWSFKSMGLFVGSWSRMSFYWLFCIQYHHLSLGCSSVRVGENDFGEALQGAQIWASYRNLFPHVFDACSYSVDDGCWIVTIGWSCLRGSLLLARGGRSCHMRNRDLCKQLRLGKNRSQQLVSIDLCFCYVYSLTCEKLAFVSAYYQLELSAQGHEPTI